MSRKLVYPAGVPLSILELESGEYEFTFQYRWGFEAQIVAAGLQAKLGQWYEYEGHYFCPTSITIDKENRRVIIAGEIYGTPWAAIAIIVGVILAGCIIYLSIVKAERIIRDNPGLKIGANMMGVILPILLIIAAIYFVPKLLKGN